MNVLKKGLLFTILATALCLLLPVHSRAEGLGETESLMKTGGSVEEEEFALLLTTEYGTLKGFLNRSSYTVFVPPGYTEEELELSYTGGRPASVSVGKLDRVKKTLTIPNTNGLKFTLKMSDRTEYTVTVLSSSVPAVFITLADAELEDVHADKSLEFTGNTVTFVDPEHPEYCLTDSNVTFHGRGNSSWGYFDKRGYALKLSEKTSVFGMAEAKSWCLIANANDGTLMKNRIAYEIAKAGSFPWSPDCTFADVWINGDYRGLYLLVEKTEVSPERLDLRDRNGVLMELDNYFYMDKDVWFQSDVTGAYVSVKDAVSKGSVAPAEIFKEKFEALEFGLHTVGTPWEELTEIADMESFAELYLINEMLLNKEIIATGLFMYIDGEDDLIHAGPVWDFDTCMNNMGDSADTNFLALRGSTYNKQTDLFALLCTYEEFVLLVDELYRETYLPILRRVPEYIDVLCEEIKDSAAMNYRRYPTVLGTKSVKGDVILGTFEENVSAMSDWLTARAKVFYPAEVQLYKRGEILKGNGYGVVRTEDLLAYFAPVFDPEYYAKRRPDVVYYFGSSPGALLQHYLEYGIASNTRASEDFVLTDYVSQHTELWATFGNDKMKYLTYYLDTYYEENPEEPEDP
ncbi:MAG: CotH kinase family protein [Lachnospiraceae bacterium]|nr:CotH kinase family protein [Lachnospiraceae bacterium]